MKKRKLLLITAAAAAMISTAILGGCGASHTAAVPQYETAAAGGAMRKEAHYDMEAPMAAEAVEVYDEASSRALTSENTMQPINSSRKLIRNANLSVETTDFDTLMSSINQNVTQLGGYMEQSDISGNSISSSSPGRRYAYLVARVPSDKLDQFITQVGEQGNITNKSESTQDVTLQYSDLESRKKSLTIEQERIWALLEKADTLEAVIALESRLSEIRYELESFESQLRLYDNQVDYSTVSLNINEVQVFTPTSPDTIAIRIQKGFSRNLTNVSQGLINFFVWFISSLPVLVVLAVIVAVIILIVRKIFYRREPAKPRTKKQRDDKHATSIHNNTPTHNRESVSNNIPDLREGTEETNKPEDSIEP